MPVASTVDWGELQNQGMLMCIKHARAMRLGDVHAMAVAQKGLAADRSLDTSKQRVATAQLRLEETGQIEKEGS